MMSRSILLWSLLSLISPSCAGQITGSKSPDVAPRPVKKLPNPKARSAHIRFTSFEFLQPYFGHEGPSFAPFEGQPSRGAKYMVEVELFGEEAIATAKFEAVDEGGAAIQLIPVGMESDAAGFPNFYGVMVVPDRPFRVVVSGEGVDGEKYRRVYERLFRPTSRPQPGPRIPPGMPRATTKKMRTMVEEETRQAIAKLEEDTAKRPSDVIVMPRTRVSNVTYAPFFSGAGRPLGIRVTYDVEFSQDGYYNPRLSVLPNYENDDWMGKVEMRTLNGSIEPLPQEAGSPQVQDNILAFGGGYLYKGHTIYHFTAEMVPDFVKQNEEKTKFCVYDQKFKHAHPKAQAAWETIRTTESPTEYRVYISNTDFNGEIEGFFAPGTIYKSFVAEGARDCGEQPTNRF